MEVHYNSSEYSSRGKGVGKMPEEKECVSIRHVSRSFGKQQVLEDINLEILEGEIFGSTWSVGRW